MPSLSRAVPQPGGMPSLTRAVPQPAERVLHAPAEQRTVRSRSSVALVAHSLACSLLETATSGRSRVPSPP